MAKQFAGSAKFQIPGGQATPAPPVGTSLGKYGINLGQFVQQFNERTQGSRRHDDPGRGDRLQRPLVRVHHQEPAGRRAAEEGGQHRQGLAACRTRTKVGTVTRAQMEEIAKIKMADLNASDVEHAVRMVAGTARSMGLEVKG